MCFTEFDEKQWEAEVRREAMEEGEKRGDERGTKNTLCRYIEEKLDDHASDEDIIHRLSHRFQLSEEQATALLSEVKSTYNPLS